MPSVPQTSEVLNFIRDVVLPFHEIKRQHKLPIGRRLRENDVEHSWTVSVLACALAPQIEPTLNVGKIAQFGIVHDLVELHAGDTRLFTAAEKMKATKAERELKALAILREQQSSFPWLSDTIADYESQGSPEAQFIYAVDKLIAIAYDILDDGRYLSEIGVGPQRYRELMAAQSQKAHRHPGVGRYFDEILALIIQQADFPNHLPQ